MEEFQLVTEELQELILYKLSKHLPYSIKAYNMAVCLQDGLFIQRQLYYRTCDDCIDSSAFVMKNIYLGAIKTANTHSRSSQNKTFQEQFQSSFAIVASQNTDLEETLQTSTMFDWSKPLLFNTIPEFQLPIYKKIAWKKGGCLYHPSSPLWLYRLDHVTKLQVTHLQPEDEIKVVALNETHATQIYSMWDLKPLLDIDNLQLLLHQSKGVGVVVKETEELISWFLVNAFGSLGILFTKKNHRKKGYAVLAITSLCKQLLEEESSLIICVDIKDSNETSKKLFKKLGFSEIFPYYTGYYVPFPMHDKPEFKSIVSNEFVF